MSVFSNFNKKVFIALLILIVTYTFLSYWAAIIIEDRPSESPILNFVGRNFSVFAKYPFLFLFIPIRLISTMFLGSFIDFIFWAVLMERIIYFILLKLNNKPV